MKSDLYDRVTRQIVSELEKGVRPWMKPWTNASSAAGFARPLRSNGVPYRGINILLLWSAASERGFMRTHWFTYKQAEALGAHVRKGEKGSVVVYAATLSREEADTDTGEAVTHTIPFLKSYTVFNADQIDGLPTTFDPPPVPTVEAPARLAEADEFFTATGADIRWGGNHAYYNLMTDHVQMPPRAAFRSPESHAATLAHELIHWTRHPRRLDRDLGRKSGACPGLRAGGDAGYAMEELVAELGAAFLCADLAIASEIRDDHAPYIASWLAVLKNDKRAIFTAAAHAQRAVDFVSGIAAPGAVTMHEEIVANGAAHAA